MSAILRAAGRGVMERLRTAMLAGALLLSNDLALAASPGAATPEAAPQTEASQSAAVAAPAEELPATQKWAIHGQSTFTGIFQPGFHAAYSGQQSLPSVAEGRETWDATLFAGFRPWAGAEIWVNPEVDQGFGPGNTFGVAGYVSAEAYKLGATDPYVRVPRLFFRQTLDLGGPVAGVEPDLNQLGGTQTANRVVVTIGKFGIYDVFDTNKYAHDARNDFLNWAIIDAGSFDAAADAWGFTYGAAVEWYQDWWTIRAGAFDMPTVPTYKYLDTRIGQQVQYVVELEERHTLFGQDGKVKLTGFFSRGLFGSYGQAVELAQATNTTPDIQSVLNIRNKGGISINLEQAITEDLGFFARAGWQDGTSSVTAYTDIDNTLSFGLSLAGKRWDRPDDTVGLGFARNDISRHFKNYLNDGGLGILIGDGRLVNAGPEQLMEAYYSLAVRKGIEVTADYQLVVNPAYNRDRGPVNFLALRLHAQF